MRFQLGHPLLHVGHPLLQSEPCGALGEPFGTLGSTFQLELVGALGFPFQVGDPLLQNKARAPRLQNKARGRTRT